MTSHNPFSLEISLLHVFMLAKSILIKFHDLRHFLQNCQPLTSSLNWLVSNCHPSTMVFPIRTMLSTTMFSLSLCFSSAFLPVRFLLFHSQWNCHENKHCDSFCGMKTKLSSNCGDMRTDHLDEDRGAREMMTEAITHHDEMEHHCCSGEISQ